MCSAELVHDDHEQQAAAEDTANFSAAGQGEHEPFGRPPKVPPCHAWSATMKPPACGFIGLAQLSKAQHMLMRFSACQRLTAMHQRPRVVCLRLLCCAGTSASML